MEARMKNPATILPDAMQALQALQAATETGGVPAPTLSLVHLRASQINGCSVCVDSGTCHLKKAGETDERLCAVAAWREAPCFTDSERAALALSEAVTRLSDRAEPVPDAIWKEAARHYDEAALAVACPPSSPRRSLPLWPIGPEAPQSAEGLHSVAPSLTRFTVPLRSRRPCT